MRRLFIILLSLISMVLFTAEGATPRWEAIQVPDRADIERVETSEDLEIFAKDGYIYITTSRPVTVKVFTILGQLISQETISPGIHRLRIASRGIYILKAGTATRRITL